MLGTEGSPGIMVKTLEDLYRLIGEEQEQNDSEFNVTLSYGMILPLHIYH